MEGNLVKTKKVFFFQLKYYLWKIASCREWWWYTYNNFDANTYIPTHHNHKCIDRFTDYRMNMCTVQYPPKNFLHIENIWGSFSLSSSWHLSINSYLIKSFYFEKEKFKKRRIGRKIPFDQYQAERKIPLRKILISI